jgi:hypothetical protein
VAATLQFTDADIRAKATEQSYDRGVDYHDSGMVERATLRGSQLFATVQGSEWDPYQVGVTFTDGDFTASCTCPYDWEGYCKHIVATLLTIIHDDGSGFVATATPIADLLEALDAKALRALVHRLVNAAPSLVEVVDEFRPDGAPELERVRNLSLAGHVVGGNDEACAFGIEFTIYSADGQQSHTLTGMVDTGQQYSTIPSTILDGLGIVREHHLRFRRDDGFVRQLAVGWVKMDLQDKTSSCPLVFGDDPTKTVIGRATLTYFAFAADPEQQRLVPGLLSL